LQSKTRLRIYPERAQQQKDLTELNEGSTKDSTL